MTTPGRTLRAAPLLGLMWVALITIFVWGQRTRNLSAQWERAELTIFDVTTRLRGPQPVGHEAIVVAIDDDTINKHPDVYEKRAGMADLVTALFQHGAKAVAIDFILQHPQHILTPNLTERLEDWQQAPEPSTPPKAQALLDDVYEETLGDEKLLLAIKMGRTILAFHLGQRGASDFQGRSLTRGTYGQVVAGQHLGVESPAALVSLKMFNRAAKRLGAISVEGDGSGITRQIPLALRTRKRHFVPMGLQLAAEVWGVNRSLIVFRGDEDAVEIGEHRVQGDRGAVWLNWRGNAAFDTISAGDVLDGVDAEAVRGRIAMIGMAHLAQDTILTPFGEQGGVQSHLTLMDNVLHDDLITRASIRSETLFTAVLGLLTAGLFLLPGLRSHHVIGVFVLLGVSFVVPYVLLAEHNLWLGSLGAKLAVVGVGVAGMATAWLQEGAEARALRGAFARYVSDDLLAVISSDPTLVSLQGQRRDLSILFSDIRNFTSHSERMDPLELVAFLNEYLTPMTRAVLDNRGFVDKFIGDAVMALFGAPVPDEQHPRQAARAALAMFKAMEHIRPLAAARGIDLAIGIGINSGEVALGNLGSGDRFEYTVLGDAVNLAARLEGLTKNYGVFCLIGPRTAAALGADFRMRTIDLVRVKGKDEPVEIFELTGDDHILITWYESIEVWNQAVGAWRSGDFPQAQALFERFYEANPDDPAAALYLKRLQARPHAPDGWDGVFTHTKK